MAHLKFSSQNSFSSEEGEDRQEVEYSFDTECLDKIVSEFYWFIRALGYDYVQSVTIKKEHGGEVTFGGEA